MKEEKAIKTYKGFDKDLKCNGLQYEVGKEYEMEDIEICKRGFHACENPFDVFRYYDMLTSRFCEVEQSGEIQKNEDDTKVCSSKIKIIRELELRDMINLGVEWLKRSTSQSGTTSENDINDNGHDFLRIGSSENYDQIGSSGDSAQIGSSGNYIRIGSSGDYAQIGSSGNSARIGSSGNNARIGSSGNSVQIGSSGNYVRIGSSGNWARIKSEGEDSVIMCAGKDAKVKAKRGAWITLAEWKHSNEKGYDVPIHVKTEYVDGKRIKENTWYKLVNGEFVEQNKNN